jgi:Anti-sigma-K factor rskA
VTEHRDLRDIVGNDVPDDERVRLERADAVLRSVPAPPASVPRTLTEAVLGIPRDRRERRRRPLAAALAFAAVLSAVAFGLGYWVAGERGPDETYRVAMRATEDARGASAVIRVGERNEDTGNVTLELDVSGLPKLPEGGYYALWLAKDGRYAGTCGTFGVGDGETTVSMNVSYDFDRYDAWVVTAYLPDEPPDAERPWLLHAEI